MYRGCSAPDFECAVCDAVNDALTLRDAKRSMTRKWLYQKLDGVVYQQKRVKGQNAKDMQAFLDRVCAGAKLINGKPDADIITIWKGI